MRLILFPLWGVLGSQVLLLLDATLNFQADLTGYSFAVSLFGDKPAPSLGAFGHNFPGPEAYCYKNVLRFDEEAPIERSPINTLDRWNAEFEALAYGAIDPNIGWEKDQVKTIALVTSGFGHSSGLDSAAAAIANYNSVVLCADGESYGGFGAQRSATDPELWTQNRTQYDEYARLLYLKNCVRDLYENELPVLSTLKETLYPGPFPTPLPFDLEVLRSSPEVHCARHEYPSFDEISKILIQENVRLLVVNIAPEEDLPIPDHVVWGWLLSGPLQKVPSVLVVVPHNYQTLSHLISKGLAALSA